MGELVEMACAQLRQATADEPEAAWSGQLELWKARWGLEG